MGEMIHDIHTAIGNFTIGMGVLSAVGYVDTATKGNTGTPDSEEYLRRKLPGQTEYWCLNIYLHGSPPMTLVFESEGIALLERSSLVEAWKKVRDKE